MYIPQQLGQVASPKYQAPTTFISPPLPLPSQIHNQRAVQQTLLQQQQRQIQEQQQSYLYQVQEQQKKRAHHQPQLSTMRSVETMGDLQGGSAPSKPWMGEDIYMVAFLLGVEVERLREENERLIVIFEQVEQRGRAITLIEGELQEGRERMGEYEKKIAMLSGEADIWKQKFLQKEKESQDKRYQNELQRRVLLDREIRELTAKFISDRNHLEGENQRLRKELDEIHLKHGSLEEIIKAADYLNMENQRLKQELANLRSGFDELEYVLKQAGDLEQENVQLKQNVNDLRSKLVTNQSADYQLVEQIKQKEAENFKMKQVLDEMSKNSSNTSMNQTVQMERLQRELKIFEQENQRLRDRLAVGTERSNSGFCY